VETRIQKFQNMTTTLYPDKALAFYLNFRVPEMEVSLNITSET